MAFDENGNWYDGRSRPNSHSFISENTFYKDTALACNKKLKDGDVSSGKLGHTGNTFSLVRNGDCYIADVYNYLTHRCGVGVSNKRITALRKACKDAEITICKDWGKSSSRHHTYKGGE